MKSTLSLLCIFLSFFIATQQSKAQLPLDANGWTILTPSNDSRLIHVSSSMGDDANGNGTVLNPYKTIEKGFSMMRDGYPDWMLLKRGDVWTGENLGRSVAIPSINRNKFFNISGRNSSEPMVVTYYGNCNDDRPILKTDSLGHGVYLSKPDGDTIKDVVINGVFFHANTRDPNSIDYKSAKGGAGFVIAYGAKNILIEDCVFNFYMGNNVTGIDKMQQNIKIRRNIITNNYSTVSHSGGMYVSKVDGLLIEENTFDHNGWHPSIPGAHPTVFNHNMYIHDVVDSITHKPNTKNVIVRGNIISRASSHGLQLRPGGIAENNLFLNNALAMFARRDSTVIRNNVVLGATDIGGPAQPRGMGINIQPSEYILLENNIVAHKPNNSPGSDGHAFSISNNVPEDYGYTYCNYVVNPKGVVRNNISYNWNGTQLMFHLIPYNQDDYCRNDWNSVNIHDNFFNDTSNGSLMVNTTFGYLPPYASFNSNTYYTNRAANDWYRETQYGGANTAYSFQQWNEPNADSAIVNYIDPNRTINTYQQLQNSPSIFEAFIDELKKQSKCNWRTEYTANTINEHIREGFCIGTKPVAIFSHIVNNSSVSFNSNASSNATSFDWHFGDGTTSSQTNPTHVYSTPGIYSVSLVATNNCTSDTVVDNIIITNIGPTPLSLSIAGVQDVSCNNGSNGTITLNTSGGDGNYTYAWNDGGTGSARVGLQAGLYSVTVSDGSGQTFFISKLVNEPLALYSNPNIYYPLCDSSNGYILLSLSGGTSPYHYSWNNGSTTSSISNLTNGNYDVTITDHNGCSLQKSFILNCVESSALTLNDVNLRHVSCYGYQDAAITLDVLGGMGSYNYTWSNGNTTATISNIGVGVYSVTVVDGALNNINYSFTISGPTTAINELSTVTPATCGQNNGSILLNISGGTAPYSLLWNTGSNAMNLTNLNQGSYTVLITDNNNCTGSATIHVECITGTGISNTNDYIERKVYPNPTNGTLNIHLKEEPSNVYLIEILNLMGEIVYAKEFNKNDIFIDLKESSLPRGIYFLKTKDKLSKIELFRD